MNFVRSGESIIPAYLSLCVDDGVYSYVKTRRRLHEPYMAGCNDRGCSIKKSLENNPSAGRGGREGERERRIDEIHREHVEDRIQIQLTIKLRSPKKEYRESCFIGLVHHHRPIDLVHVYERSCACARVPNKTRLVRFPSIEFEYLRSIIREARCRRNKSYCNESGL